MPEAKLQKRQYFVFKLFEHVARDHNSTGMFLSGGSKSTRVVQTAPMKYGLDKVFETIFTKDERLENYTLSLYTVALD